MWWVIVAPSRWTCAASAVWLTEPTSRSALSTIQMPSEPPAEASACSNASRMALAVNTISLARGGGPPIVSSRPPAIFVRS